MDNIQPSDSLMDGQVIYRKGQSVTICGITVTCCKDVTVDMLRRMSDQELLSEVQKGE